MSEDKLEELLIVIPVVETNAPISSMNSISIEELKKLVNNWKRIPTFDEIIRANNNLQEENERLKARVAYLERSNDRREDTILNLRQEYTDGQDYKNIVEELKKWINIQMNKTISFDGELSGVYEEIFDKLEELEKGSDKE